MSVNIDNEELNKFSSRATEWWDRNGEFKTLHDINPVRLQYILQCSPLSQQQILDVGCGGGILSEAMAAENATVTGIDAGLPNIECAQQHARDMGLAIHYHCTTAEEFALEHGNKFDVVTCMELLEHVPDPASLIQACAAMVKPEGHVIFSTINRHPKAYLLAILGAEYLLGLLPKGTHDYEKFIRPAELVHWCTEHELKLNNISGMSYNPVLKHSFLTQKPDVNYLIDTIAK